MSAPAPAAAAAAQVHERPPASTSDEASSAAEEGAASELGFDPETEELLQAVVALKQLQKENRQLTANFENLKAIHLELVTSYRQLEGSFASLKQERVGVEQQYQQLCEAWKAELEDKQAQFEAARAQILEPSDLGLLRAQLLEEVEGPFKRQCEAIAKEAEAAQRQYVQLRREHESLVNSIRGQELQKEAAMSELTAQLAALQATLSSKLRDLEDAQGRAGQLEQQLRIVTQQRQEAQLALHCAREEAQELRLAKEGAVVEKEQVAVRSERRGQAHEAELAELRSLVEGLSRKNRHLERELFEATRAADAAHTQLLGLQALNTSLASQHADLQVTSAREKALLQDRATAAEAQWQTRNKELLEQVLQKERQVAQLTLSEAAAVRQAEVTAAEQVAAAQAAAAAQQREAAARIAALTTRLEAAESAAAELRASVVQVQSAASLEVTTAQGEAEQLQALVGQLQQQLADATGQQAALRSSYQQLEATSDAGRAAKSDARCAQLEQQVTALQADAHEARSRLAALVKAQEQQRAEGDKRVAATKAAAAAERDALQARHAAKVAKLQEAARDHIRSLRTKLTDSRGAVEQLRAQLNSLKDAELSLLRSSVERPLSALGSPLTGRLAAEAAGSPSGRQQPPSSAGLAEGSPLRAAAMAAFVGVHNRQQRYLQDAGAA